MTSRHALGVVVAAGICFSGAHAAGTTLHGRSPDPRPENAAAQASRDRPVVTLGSAARLPVLRRPRPAPRRERARRSTDAPQLTPLPVRATAVRRISRQIVRTGPDVRSIPNALPPGIVVGPPAAAAPEAAARPAPAAPTLDKPKETQGAVVFFDDGG